MGDLVPRTEARFVSELDKRRGERRPNKVGSPRAGGVVGFRCDFFEFLALNMVRCGVSLLWSALVCLS